MGRRHGMTRANGHHGISYATDDAPAVREWGDETVMDETVRVGLVSLGRMGRVHAVNLDGRIPGARLVWMLDAVEDVARDNAASLGSVECSTRYEDLLEDPEVEAVVVASPTPLHAKMTEAAGKHVFCEKPVSLELERTQQVVEAVKEAGVRMQVGFHRHFDPDYRAAHQKISAGNFGEVRKGRTSLRDIRSPGFDYIKESGGFFADGLKRETRDGETFYYEEAD